MLWYINSCQPRRFRDRKNPLLFTSPLPGAHHANRDHDRCAAGQAKTAYLWAVLGDAASPYTTFYFTEDRSRAGPAQWFTDYGGYLVSDAYIVYELLGEESLGRIQLAACHVHARRKFESLHVLGPTQATSRALG